jgi:hypothetical protein
MNTKGTIILAIALLALLFVPSVEQAQGVAQGLAQLPDEALQLIRWAVTAGVAWLLLKVDMGGFTQILAAAIAPIVIAALERLTGMIPPVFDNLVLSLIHLLVLFIGGLGSFLLFKRAREPKTLLA